MATHLFSGTSLVTKETHGNTKQLTSKILSTIRYTLFVDNINTVYLLKICIFYIHILHFVSTISVVSHYIN